MTIFHVGEPAPAVKWNASAHFTLFLQLHFVFLKLFVYMLWIRVGGDSQTTRQHHSNCQLSSVSIVLVHAALTTALMRTSLLLSLFKPKVGSWRSPITHPTDHGYYSLLIFPYFRYVRNYPSESCRSWSSLILMRASTTVDEWKITNILMSYVITDMAMSQQGSDSLNILVWCLCLKYPFVTISLNVIIWLKDHCIEKWAQILCTYINDQNGDLSWSNSAHTPHIVCKDYVHSQCV